MFGYIDRLLDQSLEVARLKQENEALREKNAKNVLSRIIDARIHLETAIVEQKMAEAKRKSEELRSFTPSGEPMQWLGQQLTEHILRKENETLLQGLMERDQEIFALERLVSEMSEEISPVAEQNINVTVNVDVKVEMPVRPLYFDIKLPELEFNSKISSCDPISDTDFDEKKISKMLESCLKSW